MAKYLYGISKQKARENFERYLLNSYYDFLSDRDLLVDGAYELYFDPIYDENHDEEIGCRYICFFDGKREEFSDLDTAQAFSASYFHDSCDSLFCQSFELLIDSGVFTRYFFRSSPIRCLDDIFISTNSIWSFYSWMSLYPNIPINLDFVFYTQYDFSSYLEDEKYKYKSPLFCFRQYLFESEDFTNVDLDDLDFVIDYIEFKLSLVRSCQDIKSGYSEFHISVVKED